MNDKHFEVAHIMTDKEVEHDWIGFLIWIATLSSSSLLQVLSYGFLQLHPLITLNTLIRMKRMSLTSK